MEKTYKTPAIFWLKITDYMRGWLQYELGDGVRIGEQRVVTVQHLPGAREILRMEAFDDMISPLKIDKSMSSTRMNCIKAGMSLDKDVIYCEYGITDEDLKAFVPIESPKMKLTKYGVLRQWTPSTTLGRQQASALLRIIRTAFWEAVEKFNADYAAKIGNTKYPSIDMVEAFCKETNTPDIYAENIKREWNRRVARGDSRK